jgi:hypothetical protein
MKYPTPVKEKTALMVGWFVTVLLLVAASIMNSVSVMRLGASVAELQARRTTLQALPIAPPPPLDKKSETPSNESSQ